MQAILSRFTFCKRVFQNCSAKTIERFFKVSFDARVSREYTRGLFPLYLIYAVLKTTLESEQNDSKAQIYNLDSKHQEGNKRRATTLLPKLLEHAINFPLQVKILRDAQTDEKLCKELADRISVDTSDLKEMSADALRLYDKMQGKRFGFDQIAAPRGPLKKGDANV